MTQADPIIFPDESSHYILYAWDWELGGPHKLGAASGKSSHMEKASLTKISPEHIQLSGRDKFPRPLFESPVLSLNSTLHEH